MVLSVLCYVAMAYECLRGRTDKSNAEKGVGFSDAVTQLRYISIIGNTLVSCLLA